MTTSTGLSIPWCCLFMIYAVFLCDVSHPLLLAVFSSVAYHDDKHGGTMITCDAWRLIATVCRTIVLSYYNTIRGCTRNIDWSFMMAKTIAKTKRLNNLIGSDPDEVKKKIRKIISRRIWNSCTGLYTIRQTTNECHRLQKCAVKWTCFCKRFCCCFSYQSLTPLLILSELLLVHRSRRWNVRWMAWHLVQSLVLHTSLTLKSVWVNALRHVTGFPDVTGSTFVSPITKSEITTTMEDVDSVNCSPNSLCILRIFQTAHFTR